MGKYEGKLKPVFMGIIGKQADTEIADLEARVKELEELFDEARQVCILKDSEILRKNISAKKAENQHKALLGRVDAHNERVKELMRHPQAEFTKNRFLINTGEDEG